MPVHNNDIANVFDEIADFLEIEGENPFRIRAYRNGAGTVRGLGAELKDMVADNTDLTELAGIGKELAATWKRARPKPSPSCTRAFPGRSSKF
jgi:DNA polymerase (family 10)